jgi:uncharacterized protein YeaO (DUF488 family)
MSEIRVKRAYDARSPDDGLRVLVDRLWPRGLTRGEAGVDLWLKDVAPSAGLRRWFGHDPTRWPEFQDRYRTELAGNAAMDDLLAMMRRGQRITLLFGARDTERNNAVALQNFVRARAWHEPAV